MRRFNDWLAVKITNAVGTMWCAYVFAAISLISLPNALATHDPIVIVSWVAQTFLQLVLLSIILVGQKVASDRHQSNADKLDALHDHLGVGRDGDA